jgi:hypothetical protein
MTKRLASRWTLIAVVAVMAPVASLGVASPAMAQPKGIFKIFANCPLKEMTTELKVPPEDSICNFNETTGGELAIGSTKVPINSGINAGKIITLEGGGIPTGNPSNAFEYFLLPGTTGQSISKTELAVPGGLADIVDCENITGEGLWEKIERGACKLFFESGPLEVTATTEVVANTKDPALLNEKAFGVEENLPAVTLPVRVHLKNTFLGNSCYIGSEAEPIKLQLTTGTTSPELPNKPIKGTAGTFATPHETVEGKRIEFLRATETALVDNSFRVPKAEGCGEFFSFIIDPVVDSKLGLPSEDGKNTAILKGTLNESTAEQAELSEK